MIFLINLANHLYTLAAASTTAGDIGRYILLAVGLGFVIFFHELGHFASAKYCGVLVEQFAVGFGPAVVAWRKGIGIRRGTTTPEMEKKVHEYLLANGIASSEDVPSTQQTSRAMTALGFGETEYRLNWIPLGGYVKMLGQDDLRPGADSKDPRAYNNKPIRSRMLIISAGVVMNVLLAAIGFMIVFLMGFRSPPAEVGGVMINSPASFAQREDGSRVGLAVGDRIITFDGKPQHNFAEVSLTVALAQEGRPLPMTVRHANGVEENLHVLPVRSDSAGMLQIGVLPPLELRGLDPKDASQEMDVDPTDQKLFTHDMQAVHPGEMVVAIDGKAIADDSDYYVLDRALAQSDGNPVALTVRAVDGSTRQEKIWPHFESPFAAKEPDDAADPASAGNVSPDDLQFAGLAPRARVAMVMPKSPVYGIVSPGDVITAISQPGGGLALQNAAPQQLRNAINTAGRQDQKIVLSLLTSSGVTQDTQPLVPSAQLADDRRGLNVLLGADEQNTVVAAVAAGSSAEAAGIKSGWKITAIGDAPVSNWFQVCRILANASPGDSLSVEALTSKGKVKVQLAPTASEIDYARHIRYTTDLTQVLRQRIEVRKTANPIVAAEWGIAETRDFLLQNYLTLRRMISGSVSYKEAMGPVGIVRFGAMSAARGPDWLVWFLAMISSNLAVVNFLPIPVMDGGLFVLLILEAVQGRPLSAKAQQAIQMVGLAIILSVFLLVTYQDIARQFGHG